MRSLAPLDRRFGVRVTAVAPGVIKDPLWTENPEKLRLVAKEDAWVTPEFVADAMAALVERDCIEVEAGAGTETVDVAGGMILEVAKGRWRVVQQFNDPGPSEEGNTVGNMSLAEEEIFEGLGSGSWGKS